MTWNAFHHRGEILRTVVATADEQCDGVLPTHLPGVTENFENELDLLSALLLKWHARLSGNIERALTQQPLDLELAVARAWRRTADEMPGVRAIVDRRLDGPDDPTVRVLRRATEREWVRLASAAGVANDESNAAARAGRSIELRARELAAAAFVEDTVAAGLEPGTDGVAEAGPPASFVDRIKAVLAA